MIRLYPAPEHQGFSLGDSPFRALLIHGFPGTPWELRGVASLLVGLGWQVSAPLLPGFGPDILRLGSVRREEWRLEVDRELAALRPGATEVLVVGYSMGAALALLLASEKQVDELVLINPFTGVPVPASWLLAAAQPLVRNYRPFLMADFDDPWTREVIARVLPDLDPSDASWRRRLRREVKIPTRALLEVARTGWEAWRVAPEIDLPSMVIQGRQDKLVPALRTERFVARLGGKPVFRLIDGEHMLVWPGRSGHGELTAELSRHLRRPAGEAFAARRRTR